MKKTKGASADNGDGADSAAAAECALNSLERFC